jgi:hypothetical protein
MFRALILTVKHCAAYGVGKTSHKSLLLKVDLDVLVMLVNGVLLM